MDSRTQFEAWVREEFPVWGKYLLWSESLDAYGYSTTNLMYRAWQASLAAIVVDTGYLLGDGDNEDSDYTLGFNQGITKADKALRAAGITVKGD